MVNLNAIVVTGTPGVGKTTVSKLIAQQKGFRIIELNALAKEGRIEGKDPERDAMIVKPRAIMAALKKILKGSRDTFLIEGHFGEIVPQEYVKLAIVIRIDPELLKERLAERGYAESKIKENVEAELVDSCLIGAMDAFGEERVREIDATSLSQEALVGEISAAIDGKGGLPVGSVNWIAKLEKEGRIQRLLR
jgi:adenylate kinase